MNDLILPTRRLKDCIHQSHMAHIYSTHTVNEQICISKLRKKLKKSGFVRLLLYYENVFLGLISTAKKKKKL